MILQQPLELVGLGVTCNQSQLDDFSSLIAAAVVKGDWYYIINVAKVSPISAPFQLDMLILMIRFNFILIISHSDKDDEFFFNETLKVTKKRKYKNSWKGSK